MPEIRKPLKSAFRGGAEASPQNGALEAIKIAPAHTGTTLLTVQSRSEVDLLYVPDIDTVQDVAAVSQNPGEGSKRIHHGSVTTFLNVVFPLELGVSYKAFVNNV